MVQGQYQYPSSQEGAQVPGFERGMFLSTEGPEPESIANSYVAEVLATQRKIELLRSSSDDTTLPRYGVARFFQPVTSLFVAQPTTANTEKKLVNAESEIGGSLLQKAPGTVSQRFWYHGGDWFYELEDATGFRHARYQFGADEVHKLVNGLKVEFEDTELQSLLSNVDLYYEGIRTELYHKDDFDLAA